ncbi:hypothetical protein Pan97_15710 [Bremerella volcania]|uniref:STAS/SEC14 domain-containing protein n=1 Tax=Bremerella volcania TaxID=2527984 RepID=A0A518C5S6_9BACT|nr:STAS/SEC14 domain-containing protein [Bremerella volcania]QDU74562.1 hypothetical protein Pan97_15710 [Bremerella volcania]
MYKEIDITIVGKVMEVDVTGKLTKEDYGQLVPATDKLIKEHGKIRILFVMHDFHGWSAGAMWEDTKFGLKHFTHIERLGIVGETKWEHGMAVFCRPFTMAKMHYFDASKIDEARKWITED